MAVIDNTRPRVASANIFGQVAFKLINAITTWRDIHNTRKALSDLSDRELDDIGLNRSEIDEWAHKR